MDNFPTRQHRKDRSYLLSIIWIMTLSILCISLGFAFWYHSKQFTELKPNVERYTAEYQLMDNPVFFNGEYFPVSARGAQETLKLPLDLVQQWIDPSLKYEQESESIIITTLNKVFHFTSNQLNATVNEQPFTLRFPIEKIDGIMYIPIEPLVQIYSIIHRESDRNGAVMLFKQGDILQWGKALVLTPQPIRTSYTDQFPIISDLLPNERVMIINEEFGWYQIQQTTGTIGYVPKDHIELDEVELIPLEKQEESYIPWKPLGTKINVAWEYFSKKSPDTTQIPDMPGLNVISPTWFSLADGEGNLNNLGDSVYVKWAKSRKYEIWALFSNSFDPELTSEALSTYARRMNMIKQLLSYAQLYELDGINLDFENIYLKDKQNLVQFVRELTPFMHEQGLVVSMDVTVKSTSEQWSLFYDRPALIEVIDYMIIMAYDEHWASSPVAGSVASLAWVENSLKRLLNEDQLPPSKLLLGVPFYTRIWTEQQVDGKIKVSSKAVGMDSIDKLMKDKSLTPVYDSATGQQYMEYTEGSKMIKIWMEDEVSLTARIQLIHKYQLAGIASWRRGFEKPMIWSVIQQELESVL